MLIDAEPVEGRVAALLLGVAQAEQTPTSTTVMAASRAQPWRVSPTILPKV